MSAPQSTPSDAIMRSIALNNVGAFDTGETPGKVVARHAGLLASANRHRPPARRQLAASGCGLRAASPAQRRAIANRRGDCKKPRCHPLAVRGKVRGCHDAITHLKMMTSEAN